jgi:hypothetical protein
LIKEKFLSFDAIYTEIVKALNGSNNGNGRKIEEFKSILQSLILQINKLNHEKQKGWYNFNRYLQIRNDLKDLKIMIRRTL